MLYLKSTILALTIYTAISGHAQTAGEFGDTFIAEQLEKSRVNPDSHVVLELHQPIEVVFQALLFELADYSEDVRSIDFDNTNSISAGTVNVGSRRISTMVDSSTLVQRLIYYDPPNSFAYFTEMLESSVNAPLDYSIGHYLFSEQPKGQTTAEVSAVYKPSSRLMAYLVRFAFRRAFENDFKSAENYLNNREKD